MNVRKGLLRAGILFIPYLGWWGHRAWTNYDNMKRFRSLRDEAMNAYGVSGDRYHLEQESAFFYATGAAEDAFNQSIFWGAYVPAGVLVALGLGYWLYRGFRSNP